MASRPQFYHDHRHSLRQRRAAYRPRLRAHRDRRDPRFKRLDGYDVLFVTGMDEHGQKMQQTATREGLTPQATRRSHRREFEGMGESSNARADDIVRTTQPRHNRASEAIWGR